MLAGSSQEPAPLGWGPCSISPGQQDSMVAGVFGPGQACQLALRGLGEEGGLGTPAALNTCFPTLPHDVEHGPCLPAPLPQGSLSRVVPPEP